MPQLDNKGPDGKGPGTGRGLGRCKKDKKTDLEQLGKGLGQKRHSGGGEGKGQRLKSSKIFDNKKIDNNEDCSANKG